jgi:pyruvate, water dikinase
VIMMASVAWFSELNKDSIGIAGGKGANLGEMFNIGLPVPDGFVVAAQTYGEFLNETGLNKEIYLELNDLDVSDTEKLQTVAKKIQTMISSAEIPKKIVNEIVDAYELLCAKVEGGAGALIAPKDIFVAVRSSATAEDLPNASFAGQQASFLNIKGSAQLIEAVQNCWASLFTARAIYYRVRQGFDHSKVLIAAVVQQMVNSEKSGIMFTVNPATNVAEEMVIEAVFGLGEAIVSGSVTPDTYIVDKEKMEVKVHEVKEQKWGFFRDLETGSTIKKDVLTEDGANQTMHDKDILEYARLGKKIEAHYGMPQDIEWAMEKGVHYIVQSRAVTTFKERKKNIINESETEGTRLVKNNHETNASLEKSESSLVASTEAEVSRGIPFEHGEELLSGDVACQGLISGPVRLIKDMHDLNKVKQGDILVTSMTTPDMVPAMQVAAGIVTNEGGLTCHAAIVSREMGVACIVGTREATEKLKSNDIVTVDAYHGKVYAGNLHLKLREKHTESGAIVDYSKLPSTKTDVKVILGVASRAEQGAATMADGVGLLRLEFIIAQGGVHPAEHVRRGTISAYIELLVKDIGKIARTFGERPVWVRCSDLRSDEYRGLEGGESELHESDPMIGWHGIRRLLDDEAILRAEFMAVKKLSDAGVKNVGIMLPFVIRASEVAAAKKIFEDETGLSACSDVAFGVMIETPAACKVIEEICNVGISFVSFGTNDLTQLTLGIDRNNQKISSLFDEMHPAVLSQIADVIAVCKEHGVETSICGQAGSREEMAKFLVEQGVDSISANIDAVAKIRKVVAKVEEEVGEED